jgi:hypothetical protein
MTVPSIGRCLRGLQIGRVEQGVEESLAGGGEARTRGTPATEESSAIVREDSYFSFPFSFNSEHRYKNHFIFPSFTKS